MNNIAHRRCAVLQGTLVVLAAALTPVVAPSRAFAFRTSGDDPTLGIGAAQWTSTTISLSLTGAPPTALGQADAERALLEAWATWTDSECAIPRAEYGGYSLGRPASPSDGVVTVQFLPQAEWDARAYGTDTPATTVVTYISGESGPAIVDADVFVNANASLWLDDQTTVRRAALSIFVHEIGHVIGLLHICELDVTGPGRCAADPSTDSPTMHPLFFPDAASLASDDRDGACFLYPGGCDSECGQGFACSSGGCVPACTTTTCELGTACTPGLGCQPVDPPDCTASCRESGTCLEVGDPCADPCECRTGTCAQNFCAQRCSESADCAMSTTCNAGACESRLNMFGDECSLGSECGSALCLVFTERDGAERGTCTRACALDGACPGGSICRQVGARLVCFPDLPSANGCTAAAARSGRRHTQFHLAIGALLWLTIRRLIKRRSR